MITFATLFAPTHYSQVRVHSWCCKMDFHLYVADKAFIWYNTLQSGMFGHSNTGLILMQRGVVVHTSCILQMLYFLHCRRIKV